MSVETQVSSVAPAHADVLAALHTASVKTGSDFDYLLGTAMRESGLDSQAKSKGSSAMGLFQFIEQTWLGLVKRYGERHGLTDFAKAIHDSGNGHFTVASKETRAAILALRKNPELSALMAGESANKIKQNLECSLGREVCGGELYAAHFLGEGNAKRLIALNDKKPGCIAADEFPDAARANRNIFYNTDGTPKTVREVYAWAIELPDMPQARSGAKPASVTAETAITFAAQDGAFAPLADRADTNPPRFTAAPTEARTIYLGTFASRSFSNSEAATQKEYGLPQRPLLLSPGVVEILASLAPAPFAFARR
jgi:hypothetical protein